MAAAAVAGCVLVFKLPLKEKSLSALFGLAVLAFSLLMVSRFRYRSFKDIDLRSRRPFRSVLVIVAAFVGIALNYRLAILAIAGIYVLSGPVLYLASMRRGGARHAAADGAPSAPVPSTPAPPEAEPAPELPFHAR
jgi:CDP-diacylglycerol--serine O-phosphatidyltransferase